MLALRWGYTKESIVESSVFEKSKNLIYCQNFDVVSYFANEIALISGFILGTKRFVEFPNLKPFCKKWSLKQILSCKELFSKENVACMFLSCHVHFLEWKHTQ